MQKKTSSIARHWLIDTAVGALVFLLLVLIGVGVTHKSRALSFDEAFTGDVIASRAIDVTSPTGPAAENAIVAVAQLRPAGDPMVLKRHREWIILSLTFALLMGLNLAFWRHLRRVDVASRGNEMGHRR